MARCLAFAALLIVPSVSLSGWKLLGERRVDKDGTALYQLVEETPGADARLLLSEFETGADGSLAWLDQRWVEAVLVEVFTTSGFGQGEVVQAAVNERGDYLDYFEYNRGQRGIIRLSRVDLDYYLASEAFYTADPEITRIEPIEADGEAPGYLSPFWESADAGGGWRKTRWGWLNDSDLPWVYHWVLGWLYVEPLEPGGGVPAANAYEPLYGWLYFWPADYRYVYRYGDGLWYWLDESTGALVAL